MAAALRNMPLRKILLLFGATLLFGLSYMFQDFDITCWCFRANAFYPIASDSISVTAFLLNKVLRLVIVVVFSFIAAETLLHKEESRSLFMLYLIIQIAVALLYFLFAQIAPQVNLAIFLHQLAFTPLLMILLIVFKLTQKT